LLWWEGAAATLGRGRFLPCQREDRLKVLAIKPQ
jgi:hypothetical protein